MLVRSNIFKTILLGVFVLWTFNCFSQDNSTGGIKTIVIDPGHGGKDPGCRGGITNEKSVVLAIGLKLGEYIKSKYPDINVIYTRNKDVFVELDQRAKIANDNHADVFISIHANAAAAAAYGTETYVLGLHRSKSQEEVANRENSTIYFEEDNEEKYKDFDLSPDAIIARQLQLSVFLNQSINLASKIQTQFKAIGRHDRGVKQAGFLVLYKTTMPSILVETGFLTNPTEEKFLHNAANQAKIANSIFKGFQEYVAELAGVDALIENGKGFEETIKANTEKDKKEVSADKNKVEKESKEEKDVVYFKVQIETSRTSLPLNHQKFNGVQVQEYKQDGLYKYTSGSFKNDFDEADKHRKKMQSQGFENAFVVSFLNGKRIAISEARKILNENN